MLNRGWLIGLRGLVLLKVVLSLYHLLMKNKTKKRSWHLPKYYYFCFVFLTDLTGHLFSVDYSVHANLIGKTHELHRTGTVSALKKPRQCSFFQATSVSSLLRCAFKATAHDQPLSATKLSL